MNFIQGNQSKKIITEKNSIISFKTIKDLIINNSGIFIAIIVALIITFSIFTVAITSVGEPVKTPENIIQEQILKLNIQRTEYNSGAIIILEQLDKELFKITNRMDIINNSSIVLQNCIDQNNLYSGTIESAIDCNNELNQYLSGLKLTNDKVK